jgi:hypothetical protein
MDNWSTLSSGCDLNSRNKNLRGKDKFITDKYDNTVTCFLKAGIAELEKTSVVRQWLSKHVSTATKSRDRRNRYTRNNKGTVGGSALYWIYDEAI